MMEDERRRIQLVDRLTELLGAEVTDTLLGHLPPQGAGVATAAQLEDVRRWAEAEFVELRRWTEAEFAAHRQWTEAEFSEVRRSTDAGLDALRGDVDQLRRELHHLLDLQAERMSSRWRRDLLLLATPQFLVLLGIVVSLHV